MDRSLASTAQAQLRAELAWSGQHADEALAEHPGNGWALQGLPITIPYRAS
jgi:hypothetical protein